MASFQHFVLFEVIVSSLIWPLIFQIGDDRNYSNIEALTIELYSDEKDFEHEEAIEAILIAHDMPYSKTEAYIDSELMYMVTYNTSVLITHTPVISS